MSQIAGLALFVVLIAALVALNLKARHPFSGGPEWQPWFAWHPVYARYHLDPAGPVIIMWFGKEKGFVVWGDTVERRKIEGRWQYRIVGQPDDLDDFQDRNAI